jgi:cytochrome c-type biogenesis protein CcmH/NrfG
MMVRAGIAGRGDFPRAIEEARRAVSADAANDKAWMLMARIGLDSGDKPLAEEGLSGVERLLGTDSPEVRVLSEQVRREDHP